MSWTPRYVTQAHCLFNMMEFIYLVCRCCVRCVRGVNHQTRINCNKTVHTVFRLNLPLIKCWVCKLKRKASEHRESSSYNMWTGETGNEEMKACFLYKPLSYNIHSIRYDFLQLCRNLCFSAIIYVSHSTFTIVAYHRATKTGNMQ